MEKLFIKLFNKLNRNYAIGIILGAVYSNKENYEIVKKKAESQNKRIKTLIKELVEVELKDLEDDSVGYEEHIEEIQEIFKKIGLN